MLFDEFHHALLLPDWQATTYRPCCSRCRSFQADEFVHQYKAQCLGIRAATWVGIPDLGLELRRRVPDCLIEEEQARADRRAVDASVRIKQRIYWVDVKISDARQHSRRLPPVELMPCGNKAALAIELAQ